jgi:hypothetical protein
VLDIPRDEIAWSRPPAPFANYRWFLSAHAHAHRAIFRGVSAAERRGFMQRSRPDFDDAAPIYALADARVVGGYFQSTEIADSVFEGLCDRLVPTVKSDLGQSRPQTVLHVRIGDFATLPGFDVLDLDYYRRALVASGGTTHDEVVVVTDSPQIAAQRFDQLNIVHISQGGLLEDLMQIAQADRKVISNSTFAWWAARLGEIGGNRLVVGPKPWQRAAETAHLYRNEWIWIESDVPLV